MMKGNIKLLALLIGATLSGSALASTPGIANITNQNELTGYQLVESANWEVAYEKRVKRHEKVQITVTWDIAKDSSASKARLLVDGTEKWQGAGSQKFATFEMSKGGNYAVVVELCNAEGCTTSQPASLTIADTDGSHLAPLFNDLLENNKPYTQTPGTVVGTYFPEWGVYGRQFTVDKIPAHNLTHILYGFIPVCGGEGINDSLKEGNPESYKALMNACEGRQDFKVAIHDPYAALDMGAIEGQAYAGSYGKLMALKKAYPHLKILPSIGGWTLSDPFYQFDNAEKRKVFVASVKEFLESWKFFDGVDIDWEYPGGGGANPDLGEGHDRQTYTTLMKELREMLDELSKKYGKKFELSSAIAGTVSKIDPVDYGTAQQYMDHIFVMSYDYSGSYDLNRLNHHTNLGSENDIGVVTEHSATHAVEALLAQRVAPEKIVVGIAKYGKAWSGVHDYRSGKPFTGKAKGPMVNGVADPGNATYKEIAEKFSKGDFKQFYDEKAQSPYIFNEKTGDLISYDNARSTLAKGNYVRQQHLGGLFSWEVSMDNGDLLNAMNEGLGNRPFTPKEYESGHAYHKDDIVKSQGKYYQCKVTGWCGQVGTDSYYAPGAGLYWQQAWERV